MTHPPHNTELAEAGVRRAEIMRAERMDAKNTRSFQLLAKRAQAIHEIRCRYDAAYAADAEVKRSILRNVVDAIERQSEEPPPDGCVMQRPSDTTYAAERQSGAPPSPDGLRTPAEAARKLRCSVKTLNAHVASGALRYVVIGHGKTRMRRMFADSDLNDFIANQTRKDSPCPSSRTHVHRSGVSTSRSEVIAFTARRSGRPGAKRRR